MRNRTLVMLAAISMIALAASPVRATTSGSANGTVSLAVSQYVSVTCDSAQTATVTDGGTTPTASVNFNVTVKTNTQVNISVGLGTWTPTLTGTGVTASANIGNFTNPISAGTTSGKYVTVQFSGLTFPMTVQTYSTTLTVTVTSTT